MASPDEARAQLQSSFVNDPSLSASERSFRVGWAAALRRTESARPEVSPDYVARQGRVLRIVDVREEHELLGELGHVPGSDWVPLKDAGSLHQRGGRFEPLVLVCEDGTRSLTLAAWLEAAGLAYVAAMRGGIRAWREQGLLPQHDPSLRERRGQLTPLPPWASDANTAAITLEEIVDHVGRPHSVRWIKVAAFMLNGRMSCVDGRDHVAVVGTPGGDAGELVLALAALEKRTGKALSDEAVFELLRRRTRDFGRFAFHTDTTAGNRLVAAVRTDSRTREAIGTLTDPVAIRSFFSAVPEPARPAMLELMTQPTHLGCGHLRLMCQHPRRWGVRPGLTEAVLRAALELRWRGVQELEVAPLAGGHAEGAVVNIRVPGHLDAFSRVPLVAPSIAGRQMFVNHPDVARYLRRQLSLWMTQQEDILELDEAQAPALLEGMQELHGTQLSATLGELAAGLPIYDVTVHRDGRVAVEKAGQVPAKA